ncbi:hypothetical protein Rsub_00113 [Raphidocelis subcapitata]|uniref:Uncharacterized protein n=1 Tax=Raphidocelis subcapitata TaxID=307507 RepID=A0A2V0NM01_9CHLO|nr:hypothetical protein Rsub_00113 [Raphidocelis subcapitata]|eukprot:GBF87402.1 hypothetical protein Rsub_00113 [Raphidocelis subcapitata]
MAACDCGALAAAAAPPLAGTDSESSFDVEAELAREMAALGTGAAPSREASCGPLRRSASRGWLCGEPSAGDGSDSDSDSDGETEVFAALRAAVARREAFLDAIALDLGAAAGAADTAAAEAGAAGGEEAPTPTPAHETAQAAEAEAECATASGAVVAAGAEPAAAGEVAAVRPAAADVSALQAEAGVLLAPETACRAVAGDPGLAAVHAGAKQQQLLQEEDLPAPCPATAEQPIRNRAAEPTPLAEAPAPAGAAAAAPTVATHMAEQEAAARRREAQRATALRELERRAAEHGQRCLAALRIARAWRAYVAGPRRAARVTAAVRLQAGARGMAARRRCAALRRARDALAALRAELERAGAGAAAAALADARAAGAGDDAEALVSRHEAEVRAAAGGLRAAASTGSHAAHAAAQAAASRLWELAPLARDCAAAFEARRWAARRALVEAAASSPARCVAAAAEVAAGLGVPAAEVAAAVEGARRRDAEAAARAAAAAAAAPFDPAALEAALADCQRLGLGADAAAARVSVEQRRRTALGRLQNACAFEGLLPAEAPPEQRPAGGGEPAGQSLTGHGAAAAAAIAECKGLGLCEAALYAQRRLDAARVEALRRLRQAAAQGAGAGAALALQRALGLGVGEAEAEAALQPLRKRQAEAADALAVASEKGTAADFADAAQQAADLGCCEQLRQQAFTRFRGRRQAAAGHMSEAARACCAALDGCSDGDGACTAVLEEAVASLAGAQTRPSGGPQNAPAQGAPARQLPCVVVEALERVRACATECGALGVTACVRHALRAIQLHARAWRAAAEAVVVRSTVARDGWGLPDPQPWADEDSGAKGGATVIDEGSASVSGAISNSGGVPDAVLLAAGAGRWFGSSEPDASGEPWQAQRTALRGSAAVAEALAAARDCKAALVQAEPPHCAAPAAALAAQDVYCQSGASAGTWTDPALAAKVRANLGGAAPALASELDVSLEGLDCAEGLAQHCPGLQVLRLDGNRLSRLDGVSGLRELRELHVKNNRLRELPLLARATRLRWLHADGNRLAHVLPRGGWQSCDEGGNSSGSGGRAHSLHTLSLVDNNIHGIEGPVKNGPDGAEGRGDEPHAAAAAGAEQQGGSLAAWCGRSLCELRLAGNKLAGLSGLAGCCVLRVVDVRRNRLTNLQGLEGCPLLGVLLASTNALTALDPAQLARWPLLRRLDASENRIQTLCTLPPLPRLEELSLSDNAISRLDPQRASSLPQLRCLDLSFNELADASEAAARLARLPALAVLQLHDNPLLRAPGYADALPRLLPWLAELDRRQIGAEGAAPAAPEAGGDGRRGSSDASAAGRAQAAAAGSAGVALALERRLRAGPGLSMGSNPEQRRASAQQWLPALRTVVDQQEGARGASASWSRDTAAAIATQQAIEAAALGTLKPKSGAVFGGCAGAAPGDAGAADDGAAAPTNEPAAPPAWLADWAAAEAGAPFDGHGCCKLAAACADALAAPRSAVAAGRQQATQERLGAQARYETRAFALAARHLEQLLDPPAAHQEGLVVHHPYARRLAALQAAAAAEAAATALQAAWRCRTARRALETERRTAAAGAAVALQTAWRGRAVRCSRQLLTLKAAAVQRRHRAAVAIQAGARGWLIRRRLSAAIAAARAGSSAGSRAALSREDSLGAIREDFLEVSPALEAELRSLDCGAGCGGSGAVGAASSAFRLTAAPVSCMPDSAGGCAAAAAGQGVGTALPCAGQQAGALLAFRSAAATIHGAHSSGVGGAVDQRGGGGDSSRSGSGEEGNASSEASSCEGGEEDQQAGVCGGSAAARAARLEARLRALMAEWGFSDLATAKAYYK